MDELKALLSKPALDQYDRKRICRLILSQAADMVEAVDVLRELCRQPSPDVPTLTRNLERGVDVLIRLGVK
jgi:hypothetical protein